jgi:internalin A
VSEVLRVAYFQRAGHQRRQLPALLDATASPLMCLHDMRWVAGLLILVGCARHAAPVSRTFVTRTKVTSTPPPAPKPPSIWPVPVRVLTWTQSGIEEVGVLPDAPPKTMPTTAWFVEPTLPLDETAFRKLIVAVRSEHVPGLSLRGQTFAAWGDALADLPELHGLVLDDSDITDPGSLHVSLRRIYLTRTAVDDAAITSLVAAQPHLEVLALEECHLGDAAVRAIVHLRELRALNLSGTRITDAGGAQLGALDSLSILDLGRTAVAAKTVAAIRPLALHELFLDGTHVGKEIATLGGYAPGIVRFDVSTLAAYKPTDTDLAWLAGAPNLVEIGLSSSLVHDDLVLHLLALPKIRDVRLAQTPITIAAVRAVAKLSELEQADLAETPVDNASAAALLALPRLRMVRLDQTPIDDAALQGVTPSPALEELYLSRTNIGDTGAQILDAMPKLAALGLGETYVGDATIDRIVHLTKLRTLILSFTKGSRLGLAKLGALTELERLYIDATRADDDTIAALAKLRELHVLHLQGDNVSDDSLVTLRDFPYLEELTIGDTGVDNEIAKVSAWPRLRTLSLLGLAIDDTALDALGKRASLVALDLSFTEITNPAPLAGLPRLKVLGLVETKLSRDGLAAAEALAKRRVEIVR